MKEFQHWREKWVYSKFPSCVGDSRFQSDSTGLGNQRPESHIQLALVEAHPLLTTITEGAENRAIEITYARR